MRIQWRRLAGIALFCSLAFSGLAGGSGLNVVVIVNQNSTNSVQLGNYYCEQRQVPPQNLLRTTWTGGNISWLKSDFQSVIVTPLQAMLSSRRLTNQVDYVLLSMDFPYRIENGGGLATAGTNSTTSALFYGFKPDSPPNVNPGSCSLASAGFNPYAGSELPFRQIAPGTSSTNFLAVMLTASNLAQAKLIVDRAAASDSTFPTQTVYLTKTSDVLRNTRYTQFDNAIFDTRLRGNYAMQRVTADPNYSLGQILGLETGWGNPYIIIGTTFAPGGLSDVLTSYAGMLFENTGQINLLMILTAGAAGSYGPVIEPCSYYQKFASPLVYFYQSRGFTMAECYYQSVEYPYQGLMMGDPLAAPFAVPASGAWNGLSTNALLSGTTNLSLQVTAADAHHPVQQVDLFVDGTFAQTLTNIAPLNNNVLYVTLNGFPTNYPVPLGASLASIASNLTLRLNRTTYSNATKVAAEAFGDRLELRSLDRSVPGPSVSLSVSNSAGAAPALTTYLSASSLGFLDTVAYGIRGYTNSPNATNFGDFLRLTVTKTNGAVVVLGVTNTSGGVSPSALAQALVNLVNTNADLQGPDGLVAEDFLTFNPLTGQPYPQFNLRARSVGWDAAQIQVTLTGTATVTPSGTHRLDQYLSDLQPRSHLYVTAGVTNLPLTFAWNTTTQADGYHDLTAVAYEGSSVRTQHKFTQTVRIQNTSLAATFTTLLGGTNTSLDAVLQFSVVANTNNISKIELFSTGGTLTNILSQSNVVFSVAGTNLGLGLHPFYAIVTATSGKQYRTETRWIRLVNTEARFPLSITAPPPTLRWPATAGRSYDILATTNLASPFQLAATLLPTSSLATWTDPAAFGTSRFYRVRTSN